MRASLDELTLALVPDLKDFSGGCAAQNARMDQSGEADAGDVARGAEDTFEIPNSFCAEVVSVWKKCDEHIVLVSLLPLE